MELLKVNQELCNRCGTCADVCPGGVIGMKEDGPATVFSPACIVCGHCVAVCPNGALDHRKVPLANQEPLKRFPVTDPATAMSLLRSRRSIRRYKSDAVPRETILRLLEVARFAPTGGNSQGISYRVIDNADILKQITQTTIHWFKEQTKADHGTAKRYARLIDTYENQGADPILRNAPCLILALAPASSLLGFDNTRHAFDYLEIYATTLGLGTCWAGFVEMCLDAKYRPLLDVLEIPENMVATGVMMAGYPKYVYRRLVERNPLQVSWMRNQRYFKIMKRRQQ